MREQRAPSAKEKAAERADANLERIHKYAWDWFSYHAGQRTSMFNYALAAAAILAAGYGAVLDKWLGAAAAIGAVGFLVMICFIFLDFRNRRLVEHGEGALRYVEATLFKHGIDENAADQREAIGKMPAGMLVADSLGIKPLTIQLDKKSKGWGLPGHKVLLPLIEGIVCAAFLAGGVVPIVRLVLFDSKEPGPVTATTVLEAATTISNALQDASADTPAPAVEPPAQAPVVPAPAPQPQPPQ